MSKNIETTAIHAGQVVDRQEKSRGVAVHRTSAYVFDSIQEASDLFALKKFGNIYSRIQNPTQDVLEKRVSELENLPASVAFASGTAAIFNTIINICSQGENIVSASNLYGGTYTMFDSILPQFGITTKFVKPDDFAGFEAAIDENTRVIYGEIIGNPKLEFLDIQRLSAIAKKYNLPLIIDATFATPALLNPADFGANIIIHSLSKWIGGHGTAIGGIVCDAGNFDWSDAKFKLYNKPDSNYHGIIWSKDLGELSNLAFILRLRTVPLRNLGACISPDNAWIFLQGLETLCLRMAKHSENGLAVAKFLQNHPKVAWVAYPGLESDKSYEVASRYLKKGFGGMVVFGVKGGEVEGAKFIEGLKLFSHLANVGDAKSLALHPASTSHSQLTPEQQLEGGLTPDLVRLSIGLEDIDDIITDIVEALEKI
ncbi:MAG: O-acetylhomoserine aminocarboxypropyltransferase/cysteine synthase [Spirochaetales bacterium]|nr:O-acetylhomoserine aminocarboxypropyltransferase/cysteine synthase [Spirochaetales bacterium]